MSEITQTMADRATDGLLRTFRYCLKYLPGAYERIGTGGVHLINFTVPVSELNGVFVLGPEPDLAEVAAFADEAAGFEGPWSIITRTEPSQQIRDIAARHGLTRDSHTPLLARNLAGIENMLVDVPAGARVRTIDGAHSDVLAEAMAAGFEMPKSVAEMFTIPAMLDDPGVTGFVLEVDGIAVTTGQNIVDGDILGLYSGSGRPEHRRHGYFRALVSARLRDAVAKGATFAFTQNTPMSRPLYESLGFRVVENWTALVKPEN